MATRPIAAWLAAVLLTGCAHLPADDPADPLEPVNRVTWAFNEKADAFVLRPVARAYDWALPSLARRGIDNFLSNLFYPTVLVNDLLQLKLAQFGQDLGRFTLNTTFGIAGLFDVATAAGLPEHDEDFGQTLGHWGIGEGWYLMLPLLGPSNNRDLFGRIGDGFTSPVGYTQGEISIPISVVAAVEKRAQLLPADRVLEQQLDRYVFVRTLYLQRRQSLVYDGNPPKEDYGFDEEPE